MSSVNNIEIEYKTITAKNEWPVLYQTIRSKSLKNGGTCLEAVKPQNKNLNRYRDVSPYDHSRIILKRGKTDYINANLVKVEQANRQYILTQGPLINTVSHFWLMVWEQNSKAILMLNKLIEKKQEKCYQYWPMKIGNEYIMRMDDVGLNLEYIEQYDHSYYLTRLLKLTDCNSGEQRNILQFHYTTWPDFGVPTSPTAFLDFLRKVRDAGVLDSNVGPAIVHCSAGIGRSGTFCLVDSCLVLIEKFGQNCVDVKEVLYEMRKYRMGLIQTPEQLRFSYQAIIEGIKQLLDPNSQSTENHIEVNNSISGDGAVSDGSDDDGPPPLPPPRLDSLHRQNGSPIDRPLPKIPNSVSLGDIDYADNDDKNIDEYIPSGPLPVVPGDDEEEDEEDGSSEDELQEETDDDDDDDDDDGGGDSEEVDEEKELNSEKSNPSSNECLSPSELRRRRRIEQKEKLENQVRDMKRRQQANEQWTQLKRSLYKPLIIAGGFILGGGLVAYFYFKN